MAVKCFQAKVACESPLQREYLALTHRLFNEHLTPVLRILYAAIRGKHGPEFQQILASVNSAQAGKEQVEAISSLHAKPGQGGRGGWKNVARRMLAEKRILFDREKMLPGFSSEFRRKVFEMAFQIILAHKAKLAQWHEDHQAWLAQRAAWETDHADYMRVRPTIEEFARVEGQVAKRRGRWHRWLTFLAEHPQLAAWRGGPAVVHPLTKEDLAEARKKPRKWIARAFEVFFGKNPELQELDRLHGEYEREYVRPWAKRRNPDGFKHPPTLTLPSPEKHPAWFSFKKNNTYNRLDIAAGTVALKVITSAESDHRSPKGFVTYRFRGDDRLRAFHRLDKRLTSGREECDLVYRGDPSLPPRPATVKGIKLVFKDGQPYLFFTVYIEDVPSRLSIRQVSIDKYSLDWTRKKVKETELKPALRTMAIDLGIRHLAAATIMEGDKLLATRFVHNQPRLFATGKTITGIPTLSQIAAMKQKLRRRLRLRGKPNKGEESCRRLSHHIRRMSEDRFKKAARAIVDLARAQSVDLILMEKLEGLVPDAERERGINRALIRWNRGELCRWIKMLGEEFGLRTVELPPHWTSRICHRCNRFGERYSLASGKMVAEPVGKLFGCPWCGYRANADFNASINLHRVWAGSFPKVRSVKGQKGKASLNGDVVVLSEVRAAWEKAWAAAESPF